MYCFKNGWEFGNATFDPNCKQTARCLRAYGCAHVPRSSSDCSCGWSVSREKFGLRKFCRQVRLNSFTSANISFNLFWLYHSGWNALAMGYIWVKLFCLLGGGPINDIWSFCKILGNCYQISIDIWSCTCYCN